VIKVSKQRPGTCTICSQVAAGLNRFLDTKQATPPRLKSSSLEESVEEEAEEPEQGESLKQDMSEELLPLPEDSPDSPSGEEKTDLSRSLLSELELEVLKLMRSLQALVDEPMYKVSELLLKGSEEPQVDHPIQNLLLPREAAKSRM